MTIQFGFGTSQLKIHHILTKFGYRSLELNNQLRDFVGIQPKTTKFIAISSSSFCNILFSFKCLFSIHHRLKMLPHNLLSFFLEIFICRKLLTEEIDRFRYSSTESIRCSRPKRFSNLLLGLECSGIIIVIIGFMTRFCLFDIGSMRFDQRQIMGNDNLKSSLGFPIPRNCSFIIFGKLERILPPSSSSEDFTNNALESTFIPHIGKSG